MNQERVNTTYPIIVHTYPYEQPIKPGYFHNKYIGYIVVINALIKDIIPRIILSPLLLNFNNTICTTDNIKITQQALSKYLSVVCPNSKLSALPHSMHTIQSKKESKTNIAVKHTNITLNKLIPFFNMSPHFMESTTVAVNIPFCADTTKSP